MTRLREIERRRLIFGDCLSCACAKAHDAPPLFKDDNFTATDIAQV